MTASLFGFGSFFHGVVAFLEASMILIVVGGLVGFVSAVTSRVVGGLTGILVAAIIGATTLVGAYSTGRVDSWRGRHQAERIAQLEAEKAKQAKKIEEIRVTNEVLIKSAADAKADAEHNAEVVAELNKQVEALGEKQGCEIPKGVTDELNKLR